MARVSTYLNFPTETEQAFNFYKSVFGTEFIEGIMRFKDVPPQEGMPPMPEEMANLIMHIELPILAGHILMGTDAPPSMGFNVNFGNNTYVMLEPDTRDETKRLFDLLSDGAKIEQPLQDVFWGSYYGSLKDKFGVQWMFNCSQK
jgi:PhnB protein